VEKARLREARSFPSIEGAAVDDLDEAAAASPLTSEQQRLVSAHLQLVEVVAKTLRRTYGAGVELDELVALGREGLIQAAQSFVPEKDLSFVTHAWCRVHGTILDAIRKDLRRARVNAALRQALDDFAESPRSAGDYRDSDEEVDAHIETALRHAMDSAVVSLSMRAVESAEEAAVDIELRRAVKEAVEVLPDGFRDLVRMRYLEGRQMEDVAKALGVGGATARRRQAEAMVRIRAQLSAAGLVER
jgi:RNA polymerase sigma factor (sigma-70 family)